MRQCPTHYAIRAGRNLPDKEFRYLRTVIVTAAVHRGFSSDREAFTLTFRHRAGVSPYTSTFVLAETCVFGKQFRGLFCCGPHIVRYEFATFQAKPFDLFYLGKEVIINNKLNEFKILNCTIFILSSTLCLKRDSHRMMRRHTLSRSYGRCFAEFLSEGSLVSLSLLDSSTCVGLRYGRL